MTIDGDGAMMEGGREVGQSRFFRFAEMSLTERHLLGSGRNERVRMLTWMATAAAAAALFTLIKCFSDCPVYVAVLKGLN